MNNRKNVVYSITVAYIVFVIFIIWLGIRSKREYPSLYYKNHYYYVSNESIDKEYLQEFCGVIRKKSFWDYKEDGDSNCLEDGSVIYVISKDFQILDNDEYQILGVMKNDKFYIAYQVGTFLTKTR